MGSSSEATAQHFSRYPGGSISPARDWLHYPGQRVAPLTRPGFGSIAPATDIETAKANGLEPYAYLRFLFERLPYAATDADRQALLPQNLDPSLLALSAN